MANVTILTEEQRGNVVSLIESVTDIGDSLSVKEIEQLQQDYPRMSLAFVAAVRAAHVVADDLKG